ncbi:hypothetical protein HBB16_05740 [Pseudonocardia sp. MCCB 268]|nr:hypothetical protein [Pseudonocardia cytotoxica]
MQYTLGTVTVVSAIVAVVLIAHTVAKMVSIIQLGQPDPTRTGPFGPRFLTMLKRPWGAPGCSSGAMSGGVPLAGDGRVRRAVPGAGRGVRGGVELTYHLPLIGEWSLYSLFGGDPRCGHRGPSPC